MKEEVGRKLPVSGYYHWVDSEDGGYWRKNNQNRPVNSSLKQKNEDIKQVSPFDAAVRELLGDFTADFVMCRLGNRFNKAMFVSMRETGKLMPRYLKGIEFQKEHHLSRLVQPGYQAQHDKAQKVFIITIPLVRNFTINMISSLLTGYQFTVILVYQARGAEAKPQLVSTGSPVYIFSTTDAESNLTLQLPAKPQWWILTLRADSYERPILALHHRHRGMAVVDGGGVVG